MSKSPSNPGPRIEGACTTDTDYSYSQDAGGLGSYVINYCLAKDVNELTAGTAVAHSEKQFTILVLALSVRVFLTIPLTVTSGSLTNGTVVLLLKCFLD